MRRALLGCAMIEQGDATIQDVEEAQALTIGNVVDCLRVLDLYLTGRVTRRVPEDDHSEIRQLVLDSTSWRARLSDDVGTVLVISKPVARRKYVHLDRNSAISDEVLEGWRLIDSIESIPDANLTPSGQELTRLARKEKVFDFQSKIERDRELREAHLRHLQEEDES